MGCYASAILAIKATRQCGKFGAAAECFLRRLDLLCGFGGERVALPAQASAALSWPPSTAT